MTSAEEQNPLKCGRNFDDMVSIILTFLPQFNTI